MNKKEVLEIRKQFTPANCAITRICGCYVDHEKEKKMESKEAFLSLPEEEIFKYFDIFRKTLSGSIGRNLLNMQFPIEAEMPGGNQEFLLKLRNSKLSDDTLLEEFYDKIIENYQYEANYYIILIHGMYDIPGKSSDGTEMFDASEDVYDFILCSLCPVELSKPGLSYNAQDNLIEDRIRDWVVNQPDKGFLFPAFTDRNNDIHGVLYYTRKTKDIQEDFISNVLDAKLPMSADLEKEKFQRIIEDTLVEESDYDTVRNIYENINEMIVSNLSEPEPLELDQTEMKKIFEQSGVSEEKMEDFDKTFEEELGEKSSLLASNITETRNFRIKTPDIEIKVNSERMDLVEAQMVNGRKCLVIAVDEYIEVNGVMTKTCNNQ